MSHTVVRLTNAEVTSELKADELTNKISQELSDRDYKVEDLSIADSKNIDGTVLARANIHFKLPSEADSFAAFLRKFVEANLARKNESGEGFVEAVVDEHDCQHLEGKNQPCKPVEWKIE